jgi:hypothetical protein
MMLEMSELEGLSWDWSVLINESQHARKKIHNAEGFRLHIVSAGLYNSHGFVTTYHNLVHTSLDTRGDLLDTSVGCDTDNRYVSNDFFSLLESTNASCTCESIHDRHLDVQKDDRKGNLLYASRLVQRSRR